MGVDTEALAQLAAERRARDNDEHTRDVLARMYGCVHVYRLIPF